MNWKHKCNLDWLKARQKYLTASEIKELIPFTKTGRSRKISDEQYLKIYANKIIDITEDDCMSIGAAARGHIMEPYAIDAFNRNAFSALKLHHWDDILIVDHDKMIAYSPDALSTLPCNIENMVTLNKTKLNPIELGEVKSYGSEKHIASIYADKMTLEERWQLATAMYINESIETAYLIFFNPKCVVKSIGVHKYTRKDLENEINTIDEVVEKFNQWKQIHNAPEAFTGDGYFTEDFIIKEYEKKERLNP